MDEKEFLETILGFSKPWYIVSMIQTGDEIEIKLDYPKGTRFVCPGYGAENATFDSQWKIYRHLDLWQYKTHLKISVPRIKCCHGKKTVEVSWLRPGSKFTQMMESHILEMARNGAISRQAKLLRITDTRMWRVVIHHVGKCRQKADYSKATALGIDETSKKGHNYITNFVDLQKRKIMYMADGKNSATITEFARDLKAHGGIKENIINTTCDMSLAIESGIEKEFVNSRIIIDKFHVMKYFNDALNKTLRADIKAGANLKNTRYLWLKNRENLTAKQELKFQSLNRQNGKTAKAYQMKLKMQEIYAITDKQVAETGFRLLIRWLRRSRNEYMKILAKTLQNHFENIMNYFDDRLTNAILEGLNNIIQSIKHAARGFKNCEYLKAISYLHCGAFEVAVT